MAVRVVLITDRRLVDDIPARVAAILGAVPRGSVAIQIREKDLDGGPLLALTRAVIEVARPLGAPTWVNDRVDVALAAGADGVHLPERGLSLDAARALAPGLTIGVSRHTPEDASTAHADIVQLGPIWSTPGKGAPLGPTALTHARSRARLVAVGGIDSPSRAREARQAGADAVAVIRAAWTDADAPSTIAAIVAAMS